MAKAETKPNEASEQELANLICTLVDEINSGRNIELDEACREYPHFAEDLKELWGTMVLTQAAGDEMKRAGPPDHTVFIVAGDVLIIDDRGAG